MAALAAISTVSFAAETGTSSASGLNETILNVEQALQEVKNGAFSEAHLHLKTARASAEQVTGDNSIISQAKACVIQGQIEAKKGNTKESTDHLNKALGLYKSL
jgi:hypothetical protein